MIGTLYLDVDGVLADFDRRAGQVLGTDNIYRYEFIHGSSKFWEMLNRDQQFFYNLPVMPDAWFLMENVRHLKPLFLTAIPKTNAARATSQKKLWLREKFGIGPSRVITCPTRQKPDYCRPGDVLIDDRAVNKEAWEAKGGNFILHTSAASSVEQLEAIANA